MHQTGANPRDRHVRARSGKDRAISAASVSRAHGEVFDLTPATRADEQALHEHGQAHAVGRGAAG